MTVIKQVEMKERRQKHDIMVNVEQPLVNRQKVKDIIKNAELRLNMIESRIQTGIIEQENTLSHRIKMRRLKSESSARDPFEASDCFNDKQADVVNQEEAVKGLLVTRECGDENDKGVGRRGSRAVGRQRHLFASFTDAI